MNYYETLYIVHPALESGRLKDIILSIEESLKKMGGKTLSIDLWGKKRLAYLIDKQKYGTYVQLQFTGEGSCNNNLEMELEHNPNILSYLSTLIEEADVVQQENDLDTQIAGQSREVQVINDTSEKADKKTTSKDEIKTRNDETPSKEIIESKNEPIENSDENSGEKNPASGNIQSNSEDKLGTKDSDVIEKNPDSTDAPLPNSEEETIIIEEK